VAKNKSIEESLEHIAEPLRGFAVPVDSISLDPANVRKHPERNIEDIVASLRAFGQQTPIVVDAKGIVRKGNGTLTAAKRIGWATIAAIKTSLTGTQLAAYGIADNRTGETSEWDESLAGMLQAIQEAGDVDLRATGYTEEELDELLAALEPAPEITEDEVPEPPVEPITKPGDLWIMGGHRLLCGDSTRAEDVARLMKGEKADLCFKSPPYDKQRDYTDESKGIEWIDLMRGVFANLPMANAGQVLVNLGLIHRDREWVPYWDPWIEWMRGQGWRRFGWYVWDQGAGLMGNWNGRLGPSHEFVFHFNKEAIQPDKFVETKESSRLGKKKGSPGQRGKDGTVKEMYSVDKCGQATKIPDSVIRVSRNATIDMARNNHPATYPIQFPAFGMQCWPGLAYEPFSGSGTTIIAAEQLKRRCFAMEISPQYVDVAVTRWEALTGQKAQLETR